MSLFTPNITQECISTDNVQGVQRKGNGHAEFV